eukprot:4130536-Amphidinium_carterae.1
MQGLVVLQMVRNKLVKTNKTKQFKKSVREALASSTTQAEGLCLPRRLPKMPDYRLAFETITMPSDWFELTTSLGQRSSVLGKLKQLRTCPCS